MLEQISTRAKAITNYSHCTLSFGNVLLRLDCLLAMLSVVRPCFTHVLPSLETGCSRYKYYCPSLGCSIRKDHPSPILASSKPPSNVEKEETNDEATASELQTVEAQPQTSDSEMRARHSVWQSWKVRLPVGGQKVASSKTEYMEIKWGNILDPTPDNLLALLLTGLLGLAALQIFWQLFLVAITITLAALKYSVIAAILLTLLIVFL